MKEYILKPIMTPATLNLTPETDKSAVAAVQPPTLPLSQPLPRAVMDASKPQIKLGLDVHLDFIMVVAQKDHASPHAPRKFSGEELVAQVRKWMQPRLPVLEGRSLPGLLLLSMKTAGCTIFDFWSF